jgi:uncharacterized radical SAM protein YgiQ
MQGRPAALRQRRAGDLEIAHRLARGEPIDSIRDIRGTAFMRRELPAAGPASTPASGPARSTSSRTPDPYQAEPDATPGALQRHPGARQAGNPVLQRERRADHRDWSAHTQRVRLPSYEQVRGDPVLYAHASRVLHLETNPGNARALVQRHGDRELWLNPPPIPLTTAEIDRVFELPFSRRPHPSYGDARIPAWEMIRFSVNIMRGCFGGCTFCSITEHEGRIIQSRSKASILREIAEIRDRTPGFTGTISDLGGPTANMWRWPARTRRSSPPAGALLRLSGHLPEPEHGPRPADPALSQGPRGAGHQARADRLRAALRPGRALARPTSANWSRTTSAAI